VNEEYLIDLVQNGKFIGVVNIAGREDHGEVLVEHRTWDSTVVTVFYVSSGEIPHKRIANFVFPGDSYRMNGIIPTIDESKASSIISLD